MNDTLMKLEEQIIRELQKVVDKGEISPSELEMSCKAVCLLKEIGEYEGMKSSYEGYSEMRGRDPMTGRYMSRGTEGYRAMPGSIPYSSGGYNHAYPSGTMTVNPAVVGNSYGYSGHSVKDRMFMRLEEMLPEAQNEGEKQLIHEYMRKLQSE